MALNDFANDNTVVTVNGRQLTDWGMAEQPYTDEPIDPSVTLLRAQGGNAVRLNRDNPGRRVNVYLNPGSPDSAYMQGLFNSRANIELSFQQIRTLETAVGAEGVITVDGTRGRAGTTSITDDQFTMEFNSWTAMRGGA